MSRHGPGVPPEVQEQANAYALEMWRSLTGDAEKQGIATAELEAAKPLILHALELAFSRGAFISVRVGLEELERFTKRRRRG